METKMKTIKSMCVALALFGLVPSAPVWAGGGHGHHGHHHRHGGGYGGYGLALGMGLLGYGLGYFSNRAPAYPPAYGYPPVVAAPGGYGYPPAVVVPPAPPVYIQQQWWR